MKLLFKWRFTQQMQGEEPKEFTQIGIWWGKLRLGLLAWSFK